jgi:lysozyme
MQVSTGFFSLLSEEEGNKSTVYPDLRHIPTIGIGHALTADETHNGEIIINDEYVSYKNGLSNKQVNDLCSQDAKVAVDFINKVVKVSLTQNQFDALTSFVFNIGIGNFKSSTLLKVLNAGDYKSVPAQMMRWNKADGSVSQGLTNRRNKEIALWNKNS